MMYRLAAICLALAPFAAHAQTIYPLDRAEILAGAKFDLKVEFSGDISTDSGIVWARTDRLRA